MSIIDLIVKIASPLGTVGTLFIVAYVGYTIIMNNRTALAHDREAGGASAEKFTGAAQTLVELYMKRLTEMQHELEVQIIQIKDLTERQSNLQLLFDQASKEISRLRAGVEILSQQLEKLGVVPLFKI